MAQREAGMTLVEVLVALVLLSFGVLGVAPIFVVALTSNAASADFGWTGAYAVERAEQLRAQSYNSLTVGGSLTSDSAGYFDYPEPGIVVRWQVTDNGSVVSGTKVVTVRALALRAMQGPSREITLSTIRGG